VVIGPYVLLKPYDVSTYHLHLDGQHVSKYLFCALGSLGYVYPLLGIAKDLSQRGHEIFFVTDRRFSGAITLEGFERIPCGPSDHSSFESSRWYQREAGVIQVLHTQLAIGICNPDVIVTSQLARGPLIAAEVAGLPTCVLGFGAYLWPLLTDDPRVVASDAQRGAQQRYASMLRSYNDLRCSCGLDSLQADPSTSMLGDAFLLRSVPSMEVDGGKWLPKQVHLAGSCVWEPESIAYSASSVATCLSAIRGEVSIIYVQQGRSFNSARFWERLIDALVDRTDVFAFASTDKVDGPIGPMPHNIYARAHVPQGRVMKAASGVVSSGNTTSVLGALEQGLPTLLFPMGNEQPDLAEHCVRVGAALSARPDRIDDEDMDRLLNALLNDNGLRTSAVRLSHEFATTRAKGTAVRVLEALVR